MCESLPAGRRDSRSELSRARRVMRALLLGALVAGVAWLSGCGGHRKTNVTASEQAALTLLKHTTIPRRVYALSVEENIAPTTCLVVPEVGKSGQYQLFVTWKPDNAVGARQPRSVVVATINDTTASKDSYSVATYKNRFGQPVSLEPKILASFERASLDPTASRCEVLFDGRFQLVANASA